MGRKDTCINKRLARLVNTGETMYESDFQNKLTEAAFFARRADCRTRVRYADAARLMLDEAPHVLTVTETTSDNVTKTRGVIRCRTPAPSQDTLRAFFGETTGLSQFLY